MLFDVCMKFGLIGMLIENVLMEFKSFFDLILLGYFGLEEDFCDCYGLNFEVDVELWYFLGFCCFIVLFVLCWIKMVVFDELFEKIEDVCICLLSVE